MKNIESYLAYAPRDHGLLCALFYFASGNDVCGWWIGPQEGHFAPAYFLLEGFYGTGDTRFFATDSGDLYGGWTREYTDKPRELEGPIAVDQSVVHELEGEQAMFSREWLVFEGDSDAAKELSALEREGLPAADVSIRPRMMARLEPGLALREHVSPRFDLHVLEYLEDRWPLDYRAE